MTVCLSSNYGKTLRISSVPCMSGTMSFCHSTLATLWRKEKFIVPGLNLESRVRPALRRGSARRAGVAWVCGAARRVCYVRGLPCESRTPSLEFIISS